MPARYDFPKRVRIEGDETRARQYEGRASVLLARLVADLARINHEGGHRRVQEDGIVFDLQFSGGIGSIIITAPPRPVSQDNPYAPDLWIPRGFILYPVSDTAPLGWGTPVIQSEAPGETAYTKANTSPGLDVARWTPKGRLGEVLLTNIKDAGYQKAGSLIPPLMFVSDVPPIPKRTFKLTTPLDEWTAYRMEFTGFSAQSPNIDAIEVGAIVNRKRTFFKAINDHRVSLGRTPFLLPIRGRADTAQLTAEIMNSTSVLGHYSELYPATYQCSPDRTTRDGMVGFIINADANSRDKPVHTAELLAGNYSFRTDLGVDPSGFHIYQLAGGGDISAAQAYTDYFADAEHKDGIEAPYWDGGHVSIHYGFKHAFQAMHIFPNTSWIHAGNRFWNSEHAEIPAVSWFGFASVNLGFETLPVSYNNNSAATSPPADPFVKRSDITNNGAFWLNYNYAYDNLYDYSVTSGPTFSVEQVPHYAPGMDNRVFMRGRCIAIAPGYVWSAAIQKFDSPDDDRLTVYRLVVLVHVDADQDADFQTYGMTRYLRCYWVDLPNDFVKLPANPHVIIRGIYGTEDEGWPWDVVNSPYSWRGGDLIDAGTPDNDGQPNSLKYASQWIFSPSGMKAICMRDHGSKASYASAFFIDMHLGSTYEKQIGLIARAFELTFSGNAFNPLTVSPQWYARNTGATTISAPSPYNVIRTIPYAAGYDIDNAPSFFMISSCTDQRAFFFFTGDYNAAPASPIGTAYSAEYAFSDLPGVLSTPLPMCLDVKDQVVMAYGFAQMAAIQMPEYTSSTNPEYEPCWFQSANGKVLRVTAWRAGDEVHQQWYANPDQVIPRIIMLCNVGTSFGTLLQQSICDLVIPSYAAHGNDWVLSYDVQPQTQFCWTPSAGHLSFTCGDPGACIPVVDSITTNTPDQYRPTNRGGWMSASFSLTPASLASKMQTPGNRPRSLYSRVV